MEKLKIFVYVQLCFVFAIYFEHMKGCWSCESYSIHQDSICVKAHVYLRKQNKKGWSYTLINNTSAYVVLLITISHILKYKLNILAEVFVGYSELLRLYAREQVAWKQN